MEVYESPETLSFVVEVSEGDIVSIPALYYHPVFFAFQFEGDTMIHFIVHGKQDTVGVMVADVAKDQKLTGWNMESDETLDAVARDDIPLSHKIAMKHTSAGEKVIKYNVPIGNAIGDIPPGRHVHTHNLKSARW